MRALMVNRESGFDTVSVFLPKEGDRFKRQKISLFVLPIAVLAFLMPCEGV